MTTPLPHNVDAEKAILSAMFINTGIIGAVASTLKARDFYKRGHQLIFQATVDHEAPDAITISNLLKERDQLKDAGGDQYIIQRHVVVGGKIDPHRTRPGRNTVADVAHVV